MSRRTRTTRWKTHTARIIHRWTSGHSSATDKATHYELWRVVNRGHRELVGEYRPHVFAARDDVPEDAAVVKYAVLAFDADGEIVGRSRPTAIRFPVVSDRVTDAA